MNNSLIYSVVFAFLKERRSPILIETHTKDLDRNKIIRNPYIKSQEIAIGEQNFRFHACESIVFRMSLL